MFLLENPIQPYAWGSRSAIAGLQQRPDSQQPEAELWLGAHPKAPSQLVLAAQTVALDRAIAAEPARFLSEPIAARYEGQLPFLLKALAAATPLSLQAHPSIAQAVAGYAAEDATGIPLDAPHRNYRDRNHKPELICALTPFDALCGFRPLAESRTLFGALLRSSEPSEVTAAQLVAPLFDASLSPPVSLQQTFAALMGAPAAVRALVSNAVAKRAAQLLQEKELPQFAGSLHWAVRLAELYPGDIGVASSLLLNQVRLEPGQALYLPAGNLHAYLEGFGIELMANSDNVLRGGCTPKHVDVPELLRVLDFTSGPATPLLGEQVAPGLRRYVTAAPEFELSVATVDDAVVLPTDRPGPELLLVSRGHVVVSSGSERLELRQGQSVFALPAERPLRLTGQGTVFRATVGAVS